MDLQIKLTKDGGNVMPAKQQTVSMSRGKTAIEHDLREHSPNNVDASMTIYNEVLIDELGGRSLAEFTNDYMKQYIEEYNNKQRRSDRKKSFDYAADYIKEQYNMEKSRQNYTSGKLAYEYVIQFGDHQTMDINEVNKDDELREDVLSMFREFIESYQSAYPHMRIILATVHMDEPKGTPHMHILVQPIGEGYKQGLSHQVSITKALACDGFERTDKKGDRFSMTRWQDDVKINIMQRILEQHEYERLYKDGEKHHMPVGLYKKTMAEHDTIIEDANDRADQITSDAYKELELIEAKKGSLIEGTENSGNLQVPYDEWSMEDLIRERSFYLEGIPGETVIDNMSLPQLRVERNRWIDKYNNLVDGYVKKDGTHTMGYNELVKRHKTLMEEPARLLETDEGKKVIEDAKEEIVAKIQKNLFNKMLGFVKTEIFDAIKHYLVEPLYDAIDKMMYGHNFKLNDDDRRILTGAISKTVDTVVRVLHIGEEIEDSIMEHMPDQNEIQNEVQEQVRKRGRGR